MSLRYDSSVFASLLICAVLSVVAFSCAKSPDTLYKTGKEKIVTAATFEEGKNLLVKFVENYPDDTRAPEVYLAIATALQGYNRPNEAEAAFKDLIDRYPQSAEAYKAMFLLGYLQSENSGKIDLARETLTRFIETYPDSELTVSAQVLLDNIGRPIEEWSIIQTFKDSVDAAE